MTTFRPKLFRLPKCNVITMFRFTISKRPTTFCRAQDFDEKCLACAERRGAIKRNGQIYVNLHCRLFLSVLYFKHKEYV